MDVASTPYGLVRAVPGCRKVSLGDAYPDGVDPVPSDSLLVTHGATMGAR